MGQCKTSKTAVEIEERPIEDEDPIEADVRPTEEDPVEDERLTVIVVHYNPQRFKRRSQLVNECLERLSKTKRNLQESSSTTRIDLNIVAVELLYEDKIGAHNDGIELVHGTPDSLVDEGSSESEISPIENVRILRRVVPSKQVMWSKEQLINLAVRTLPDDEKYVAWIDSDVAFTDDSWVSQTIDALSQHDLAFAQLWATCDMLGPNDEKQREGATATMMTSFAQQRALGKSYVSRSNRETEEYWHPGFAWAATTKALEKTGNLIDKTLGSADRHMAMSFLSRAEETVPDNIEESYKREILDWERKVIENEIELVVVPTHIVHYWHGPLRRRQYVGRWKLLQKHRFDPSRHLSWDEANDLYYWNESCPVELIEDIEEYFQNRQEDSSDKESNTDDEGDSLEKNKNAAAGGEGEDEGFLVSVSRTFSGILGLDKENDAVATERSEAGSGKLANNTDTLNTDGDGGTAESALDFYA